MEEPLTYLQNALHAISQALLYPAIALLLVLVGYALFSIGSMLVEYFRERRYFKVAIPKFLRAIKETPAASMNSMLATSGLLAEQQNVMMTVYENRDLDEEGLWALAKRLLLQERERRQRVVSRNDSIAKLAPMIGLMGTLIPLGPGIVAFGRGDGSVMASAMLIAFDTTVTGLVVAAVMFVIARVRRRWYASYQASLEAGVTTLLERIGKMRDAEQLPKQGPTDQPAAPTQPARPAPQAASADQPAQPAPQAAQAQPAPQASADQSAQLALQEAPDQLAQPAPQASAQQTHPLLQAVPDQLTQLVPQATPDQPAQPVQQASAEKLDETTSAMPHASLEERFASVSQAASGPDSQPASQPAPQASQNPIVQLAPQVAQVQSDNSDAQVSTGQPSLSEMLQAAVQSSGLSADAPEGALEDPSENPPRTDRFAGLYGKEPRHE